MNFIKNFLVISRANIQISSLPTASLGIVLASKNWTDILNLPVLLYIIFFFIVLTYSCNINCLNDLEVDEKSKTYLSSAVKSIGYSRLKILMTAELVVAGVIIFFLCILKRDMIYLFAVIGILCGHVYSAPPLRLKKRGILSPIPVVFGLYFLPVIAGWFLIASQLSFFIVVFGIGYALIMQGITFINMSEDYDEDRISGIHTFAHVLGIRRTLYLGSAFVTIGGFTTLALIVLYKLNLNTIHDILFIIILLFSAYFLISIINISTELNLIGSSNNPLKEVKKNSSKMPKWFLMTRYPLFFISLLLTF